MEFKKGDKVRFKRGEGGPADVSLDTVMTVAYTSDDAEGRHQMIYTDLPKGSGWYAFRYERVEPVIPEDGDEVELIIRGTYSPPDDPWATSFSILSGGETIYLQNSKKKFLTVTKKKEKTYTFKYGDKVKKNPNGPILLVAKDYIDVPGGWSIRMFTQNYPFDTSALAKDLIKC